MRALTPALAVLASVAACDGGRRVVAESRSAPAEVDDALKPALEAARKAQSNASVYEQTRGFHEADFLARRVVDLLIDRLGAPAAK